MARTIVAIALLLVAAVRADAAVLGFLSFEDGFPQVHPTPIDFSYWAPQPTPTGGATPRWPVVSATNPPTLPAGTKRWSLRFQPESGADHYRCVAIPSQTTVRVTMAVRFNGLGASGSVGRLAWFENGTTTGALLNVTSAGTGAPTLNVHLGDATTSRCSGSTNDGKACTSVADCSSVNPTETACGVPIVASVPTALNAWRLVTLTQDNGSGSTAGQLTGGLWEGALRDTLTGAPASYSRGADTVTVGFCAGGSRANEPCNVSGDCPSSSCTTTAVVSTTRVCFGKPDAGTFAGDWQMAWALIQNDATPWANQYVLGLDPGPIPTPDTNWANVGSAHSCGANNLPACLNDGANGGADGGASALGNGNAAKPTVAVNFADAPTPSVAATPKAIVLEGVGNDAASGGSNSAVVQLRPEYAGTVTPNPLPTAFDLETFPGTGGAGDPYYRLPSSLWERAWTGADVNSLTGVLRKVSGSGNEGRVSSLAASVLYQTTDPVVPTVLPDRDQDGQDTVCWAGDSRSTSANSVFRANIIAGLVEPTNLYFYTRGGSKWGDTEAELPSLIEGATGTFLANDKRRGTTGKTCDVLLIDHLANVMNAGAIADPQFPTALGGVNQQSYCYDDGGADHGNRCLCPDGELDNWTSHYHMTPAPNVTPAARYVVAHGQFGQECGDSSAGISVVARCSSNADCAVNGANGACATATPPTPAVTPGGVCVGSFGCSAAAAGNVRQGFCVAGCKNAQGCPNGVCAAAHSLGAVQNGFARLQAAIDARPTPAATPPVGGKPIVVYVMPPEGLGLGCWSFTRASAAAYHGALKQFVKANGLPFIDLYARFHRDGNLGTAGNCPDPCSNPREFYRDGTHFNANGQAAQAAVEIACLTNAEPGEAPGTSTHDGICTSNVCTRGLVGDACATAEDCDTWSCDLGAQP